MLLDTTIPARYILNKIKYETLYVFLTSILVLALTELYGNKFPVMPLAIPTFIGTAISILLSFKLNQSYDRWWEARKVWGSIVNDSRTLVIQLNTLTAKGNEEIIRRIAYRQIAWCYSLGQSLRGLDPVENLREYLSEDDLKEIASHANKPLAIVHQNSRDIRMLRDTHQMDAFSHVQIDDTLVRLVDSQGRAERIKTTVFPVTYRKFLHFTIYLFVVTLSISLRDVSSYFEIPLLLLISSAFFLLERSATHMQDPFENRPTDTAVTTISKAIEINIKQLVNEPAPESQPEPETFYQL